MPASLEPVVDVVEVGAVAAKAAVLVLHLNGDDGSTSGGLEGGDHVDDGVQPAVYVREVAGVAGAQVHRLGEEVGGEAAEVPFGADVGPRAHDDVEAEVACQGDEGGQVPGAGEVELAPGAFVDVPRHIGLDGVQAQGAQSEQAIAPQGGIDAKVVDGAADDLVRCTLAQEVSAAIVEHRATPFRSDNERSMALVLGGVNLRLLPGWDPRTPPPGPTAPRREPSP